MYFCVTLLYFFVSQKSEKAWKSKYTFDCHLQSWNYKRLTEEKTGVWKPVLVHIPKLLLELDNRIVSCIH